MKCTNHDLRAPHRRNITGLILLLAVAALSLFVCRPAQVGGGSEPCSAAQVGSMRYNPEGQFLEICTYP